MQALRLNEVLTRVVAWHNRHPLARRITALQVHSVGEVLLPFASAQPLSQAAPAAAGPVLQDLLDPPQAALPALPPALAAAADALGAVPPPDAGPGPAADWGPPTRPDTDAAAEWPQPPPAEHPAQARPTDHADPAMPDSRLDASASAGPEPAAGHLDPAGGAADSANLVPPQAEAAPAAPPSRQDEADDLFGSIDPPGAAAAVAPDSADPGTGDIDDGPEMLVELSADPDPTDPGPAPTPAEQPQPAPEPAAFDDPAFAATLVLPQHPVDSGAETGSEGDAPQPTDSASADLHAAFAAATADTLPADRQDDAGSATETYFPATLVTPPDESAAADPPDAAATPNPPRVSVADAPDFASNTPTPVQAAEPAPSAAVAPVRFASPPPAAPASFARPGSGWARLRAWVGALMGRPVAGAPALPRLQALFSRDFIWPLRPRQVARWARRHGSPVPLAPADWPRRVVDHDAGRQASARSKGLAHDLPLHVLTAAIGIGDRRIRVLIDAQGNILGPRAYSRPRVAALSSVAALGLLGAGWGWLPPRSDGASQAEVSAAVAATASAAAQAASAAARAAAAASAAEALWLAQQGEAPAAAASATGSAHEAGMPAAADAALPALAHATDLSNGAQTTEIPGAALQLPADDDTAPPAARARSTPLGHVQPWISEADKAVARQQATTLRGGAASQAAAQDSAAANAPGPVFAVVTRPTRERDSAARSLALMRASTPRLSGTAPEHGELMQHQGEWRAAWWPFISQADAERARVMLTARGLKAEVVEF